MPGVLSGRPADLVVRGSADEPHAGLRIVNERGALRIERLRVWPWNGTPPPETSPDRWRVERTDGTFVAGALAKYDTTAKRFLVTKQGVTVELPSEQVFELTRRSVQKPEAGSVRAAYFDGTEISGALVKTDDTALWLEPTGMKEVRVPLEGLRVISVR